MAKTSALEEALARAEAAETRATLAEQALGEACLALYGYGRAAEHERHTLDQRITQLAAEIAALKAQERSRLFKRLKAAPHS